MSDSDSTTESIVGRERKSRGLRGSAKVAAAQAAAAARPARETRQPNARDGLQELAVELDNEESAISILRPSILVFLSASLETGEEIVPDLDPKATANSVFLGHERSLDLLHAVLSEMVVDSPEQQQRLDDLVSRSEQLRQTLRDIKSRARQQRRDRRDLASHHDGEVFDNVSTFTRIRATRSGPHLALAFVVVCAHLILRATVGLSHPLLLGLDIVLATLAVTTNRVPHDLRTALSWFPLDADFESVAVCPNPECCKLHVPDEHNRIPQRCDATFGSWTCNWTVSTKFLSRGIEHYRPIRSFHCQSVKSWIGKLLARPGMEDLMSQYVDAAVASKPSVFGDIWHTSFLRNFTWAAGTAKRLSPGFASPAAGTDLRLLFSVAIDWFTAHGAKQAGKKWSIGAIYLVCHNLPLDIRFKPENVCLIGIIPGRTKPLGQAVNWFLIKLVGELVSFYERGVWYTQTFKFPLGRLVWGALGPVVCDLDAARGIAGLASVSHTLFCSICNATRSQISDFDSTFTPRGGKAKDGFPLWTRFLELWRRAKSAAEQAALWKEHGIRWSEFARLRYWNPFEFLVIDPMHNLFLGLLRRHFRFVWGMDVDADGWGDERQLDPGQFAYARTVFARRACDANELAALAYLALQRLADGCRSIPEEVIKGRKAALIEALLEWKKEAFRTPGDVPEILSVDEQDNFLAREWLLTQPSMWKKMDKAALAALCLSAGISATKSTIKGFQQALKTNLEALEQAAAKAQAEAEEEDEEAEEPAPSQKRPSGKKKKPVALGRGILAAVSKDILRTVLPDWIDRAPTHIGNTKHGKLSANQWRILCTVHCVITLIRIWGVLSLDSTQYLALENFVYLVRAVDLATMRLTNSDNVRAYSALLKRYLNGLKVLYPKASITPNHHLAMHLPAFLLRFGPPHSWWAFPYERYNGMLQKSKTNDIIGQMEKTIMQKFMQASQLKWLIADETLPDSVKPLAGWAAGLIRSEYSGSLLVENDAAAMAYSWHVEVASNGNPSRKMMQLLKRANISTSGLHSASSIQHRGMKFAATIHESTRANIGNSIVQVRIDGEPIPACIREIVFSRPGGEEEAVCDENTHILVDLYADLSQGDCRKDPYARWRTLGDLTGLACQLRYARKAGQRIVRMSDVICHAAMCEYEAARQDYRLEEKSLVFLGLNRFEIMPATSRRTFTK